MIFAGFVGIFYKTMAFLYILPKITRCYPAGGLSGCGRQRRNARTDSQIPGGRYPSRTEAATIDERKESLSISIRRTSSPRTARAADPGTTPTPIPRRAREVTVRATFCYDRA